jgi:hypothetical protein
VESAFYWGSGGSGSGDNDGKMVLMWMSELIVGRREMDKGVS